LLAEHTSGFVHTGSVNAARHCHRTSIFTLTDTTYN
jgi:hypothetical protein